MMKVIFLDVDGVLDSNNYFTETNMNYMTDPVDMKAVARLAKIVEATGARLVLSSSWRHGWDHNYGKVRYECKLLMKALAEYGMRIYDKTGTALKFDRAQEVKDWLRDHRKQVESFLILDDCNFGWKQNHLHKRWLQTDFNNWGLIDEDIPKAIRILNKRVSWLEWKVLGL